MELHFLHHGINITTIRIVSEEMELGTSISIKKAVNKCIIISGFLGIISCILFCICHNFIVSFCFHNKVSSTIVYLIAVALPLISISSCISGYFTAVRRPYKSVIANALEYLAKIFITIYLLKKYTSNNSIENICFCLILGDVLSEICSFTYNIFVFTFDISKHFLNNSLYRHSTSFLYRIFRILTPIALTSYIRSGLSTVKQLLIPSSLEKNGMECETSLAEYGTITGMAMPIITFPATIFNAISGLIIPEISKYFVKKDYPKIQFYAKKLLLNSLYISSIIAIILFVFGNNLGLFFYKDISIGYYIKIFSPIIPIMYIDIIVDSILKGLDAQLSVLFINIIDIVTSIIFIFFFVPIYGINGFIASIYISELLNFAFSLYKLYKVIKPPIKTKEGYSSFN